MDQNVIVTLLAANECAGNLFRQPHNATFYIAPSPLPLPGDSVSRETSLSVELDDNNNTSSRIQLTFDKRPRMIVDGFTFGKNPKICDVYLPKSSISNKHFSITFDDDRRLCLIDTSSHGSWVSYNGQRSLHPRHFFIWMLSPKDKIEVDIGEKDPIRFIIQVPNHPYERASLASYLEDRQRAGPSRSDMHLFSQHTTPRSSRATSPRRQAWYFEGKELGRGGFGTVHEVCDVSKGVWFALKKFSRPGWRREIDIMKTLSHEHIVRYIDASDKGEPYLVMELLLGNLFEENKKHTLSMDETLTTLCQGLRALQYIHSQGYAHRDIKPQNILIQSRTPMYIKLADFGCSQSVSALFTICGTSIYHAPELWAIAAHKDRAEMYTTAVDIWALGVVIFHLAYDKSESVKPQDLPQSIIKAVNTVPSGPLADLLRVSMLVESHHVRSPAEDCLKEATDILGRQSETNGNLQANIGNNQGDHPPESRLRRSSRLRGAESRAPIV